MELMKAYQAMPTNGNIARIYEFRGRYHRRANITDQTGKPIKIVQKGKPRFVLVAAGTLHDAVVYLHARRPTFFLDMVAYRGELRLDKMRLKFSDELGSTALPPANTAMKEKL